MISSSHMKFFTPSLMAGYMHVKVKSFIICILPVQDGPYFEKHDSLLIFIFLTTVVLSIKN